MAWVLLALGLVVLLLLVPVSARLDLATEGQPRVAIRPRWGPLTLRTWHSRAASGRAPGQKARPGREVHARSKRPVSWRKLRALLTSEDFLASLGRWLGRLLRLVAPAELHVHLRIGVGDPYETARLAAALAPLFVLINRKTSAELELDPDYVDETFAVEAHARFRIVPLVLLAVTFGYFLTAAPWRAVGCYARA